MSTYDTADRAARRQELLIESARDLLKPTPVRIGLPNWFRRRLLAAYGCNHGLTSQWAVLDHLRETAKPSTWLDHVGTTTWHKQPCFVAEPYHLALAEVQSLARVAEDCGCQYKILANSWHFPGQTLRVLFYLEAQP